MATQIVEVNEHPDLQAYLGLPDKIVKLHVCTYHALHWKIGWLLSDHGYPISPSGVTKMLEAVGIFTTTKPYLD